MTQPNYKPYVPDQTDMPEFTFKALALGFIMSAILGAANVYLGLKAGMTVSAVFPAAVGAMAVLRMFKGSILEENTARVTGTVAESLAAGAIFTVPAFILVEIDGAPLWKTLDWGKATALILIGGFIGVLFTTIVRRTLVQDKELLFPESVACAEIVKAGQKGASGAAYVFGALGLAAVIEFFKNPKGLQLFSDSASWFWSWNPVGIKLGNAATDGASYKSGAMIQTPAASPALIGVGYLIGPRLASLSFSGAVLGWMLFIPAFIFFNPQLVAQYAGGAELRTDQWADLSVLVWRNMVRPIAVGTMITGAFFTLFRMRSSLLNGMARAYSDMKAAAAGTSTLDRTDRDIGLKGILLALVVLTLIVVYIYYLFCGNWTAAFVAGLVMLVAGFLFTAVAGYLSGIIGNSSNPVSGLALSTLVIAGIMMYLLGMRGGAGVAAVLGVTSIACVIAAVAGDMVQDLKVGYILGGTPSRMEWGGLVGVVAGALVMVPVISLLHQTYGLGVGLPAPQAGLMAIVSKAIITQQMAWPLIIFGIALGIVMILMGVKSLMIIAVGMYLPFGTTAAMFVGGMIKGIVDQVVEKRKFNDAQKQKVENSGTLLASGLVAGEALVGILIALLAVMSDKFPALALKPISEGVSPALLVFLVLGAVLIYYPVRDALKKD